MEDLIIVGAGPAGLAAASAARSMMPLVVEAGRIVRQRRHEDPVEAVQGVGGAGLFSDGKFSFWPSATKLWSLNSHFLELSYSWLSRILSTVGIVAPEPAWGKVGHEQTVFAGEKRYLSLGSSYSDRERLVEQLASSSVRLRVQCRVTRIVDEGGSWTVELDSGEKISSRFVIIATGRLGPLALKKWIPGAMMRHLRFEAGVRIEQPADRFFLDSHGQLDPKFIWRSDDGRVEWRTFCCCRQGKVVDTRFDGLTTACGRADCPPTGWSNVGFNVRMFGTPEVGPAQDHLLAAAKTLRVPVRQRLSAFLDDQGSMQQETLESVLGVHLSARLAEGLCLLMREFPEHDLTDAVLVGPTVEGVGLYPLYGETLETPARGLWVAGDLAGTFRGLTAALLSGHVAGQAVVDAQRSRP
ncbi:hypothetical protein ACFQ05_11915 [Amycolatopsis umgeniensis]|uniref:Putative FAD-dependent dehydrogenase n=1 Tax=Amycolatopsis umgeniensis TaxID=336628 RepID=A0A841B1M4_9PSEU|nr:hypothetical protein [Amycolatopsis umgeniensis]MBB5854006.1 putative FAD-dependent dehydrogenase [Amycolatopsis umgeniensis]